MPLVIVTSRPAVLTAHQKGELGPLLTRVVSKALHGSKEEGSDLTPEQIEVRFTEPGRWDCNVPPFSVTIYAAEYESRKANKQERSDTIAEDLRTSEFVPLDIIGDGNSFVELFLGEVGFTRL